MRIMSEEMICIIESIGSNQSNLFVELNWMISRVQVDHHDQGLQTGNKIKEKKKKTRQ